MRKIFLIFILLLTSILALSQTVFENAVLDGTTTFIDSDSVTLMLITPTDTAFLRVDTDSLDIIIPVLLHNGIPIANTVVYDTLAIHLDSLQAHNTRINNNVDSLGIHLDTLQAIRVDVNSNLDSITNSPFISLNNYIRPRTITDSVGIGIDTPDAILDVAGRIEISGTGNSVFIGEDAGLNDDLSSNENVFVGLNAGKANTTGDYNVGIGTYVLRDLTAGGTSNTAIGYGSLLSNTTGRYNIAIGRAAFQRNTEGQYNIAIGDGTFDYGTTDIDNSIAIGVQAGKWYRGASNQLNNATQSIFIGYQTRANANSETNQTVIGDYAIGNGSNTVTLGDDNVDSVFMNENGDAIVHLGNVWFANGTVMNNSVDANILNITEDTVKVTGDFWVTGTSLMDDMLTFTGGTVTPASLGLQVLQLPTDLAVGAGLSIRDVAGEAIIQIGTNHSDYYTGPISQAKAGAMIRMDTRNVTPALGTRNYSVFQIQTRAAGAAYTAYTVPVQFAAAPNGSMIMNTSGEVSFDHRLTVDHSIDVDDGTLVTSGLILNGSDSLVDADAVYDWGATFVTGLDFTNISDVQIFRKTDTISVSAGHGHTELALQSWADRIDDTIALHLDTLQVLRTDINANLDSLGTHLDTLQAHNTRLIALEGVDTTGLFHTNRTALNAVSGTNTGDQGLTYNAGTHTVELSAGSDAIIPLAVDDGATEGLASFAASDFTATAGNIVIDYANGQKVTTSQPGFATSTLYDSITANTNAIAITDNYIAVGTGTSIEGDPNFTWNGSEQITTGTSTKLYLDSALMQYPENYNAKALTSVRTLTYIVHDTVDHDNASWHDLFLDGDSKRMVLPDNTGWTFNIIVTGIETEFGEYFSYRIEGFIWRVGGATTLVASTVTTIAESDAAFDCQVVGDALATNSLSVQVKDAGSTGDIVKWAARVDIIEVWGGAAP